jgi:hypothetical protein
MSNEFQFRDVSVDVLLARDICAKYMKAWFEQPWTQPCPQKKSEEFFQQEEFWWIEFDNFLTLKPTIQVKICTKKVGLVITRNMFLMIEDINIWSAF